MSRVRILLSSILFILCLAFVGLVVSLLIFDWSLYWYVLFTVVAFVFDVVVGFYVLSNKYRTPTTKTCWLFAIIALPLFGAWAFLIFGTYPFSKIKLQKFNDYQQEFLKYENFQFSKDEKDPFFVYSLNSQKRPIYYNNKFELVEDNTLFFEKYIELIRSAKKSILLSTYTIQKGFFLNAVINELINKAKQKVKIKFLYDSYGSYHLFNHHQIQLMRKNKIEVRTFNSLGFQIFKNATNFRNHKKMLIIDNATVLTGGSNISDKYLSVSPKDNSWKDTNYILKGDIVKTFILVYCLDWYKNTSFYYNKRYKDYERFTKVLDIKNNHMKYKNSKMQLTTSFPNYSDDSIHSLTCSLINSAKKSIIIVSPYLSFTPELFISLKSAILKGVEVKIITSHFKDNKGFVLSVNRFNINSLPQQKNFLYYEYNSFIHSKYIVIDNNYVYTGSANFDIRSMITNYECSLLIDDKKIANTFNSLTSELISGSTLLSKEEVAKLIEHKKFWLTIMNIYKPLL